MELLMLTACFMTAAGIGYIPVKMLKGYKDWRRKRNHAYHKLIKARTIKLYDNSSKELS